jgi:type III secretory pathway component EscU
MINYEEKQIWFALLLMLLGVGFIVWSMANGLKDYMLGKKEKSKEEKFSEEEFYS